MRSKGFDGMVCSVADVMGSVGDRWGMLVMRDLLLGITRYDDLRRSTEITNATLSDRLKALEQAGLVKRRRYQSRPERHEYIPTEKGRDIALLMLAMVQIGDKWRARDGGQPPLRFFHSRTGHDLMLAPIDVETRELVASSSILVEPAAGTDESMRWRMLRGEAERASRREINPNTPGSLSTHSQANLSVEGG